MSTSQRVGRGFHRLGLFLAAIPLLVGGWFSVLTAKDEARIGLYKHQQLVCAHEHIAQAKPYLSDEDARRAGLPNGFELDQGNEVPSAAQKPWELNWQIRLKQIGCSEYGDETVTFKEAHDPPDFKWLSVFARVLGLGLAISLAVSFAVYGVVCAIGWVIGGFAAS